MNRKLLLFMVLAWSAGVASAGSLQTQNIFDVASAGLPLYNNSYTSLSNPVIVNVPYHVVENTAVIDTVRFMMRNWNYYGEPAPNGDLHVRVYKRYGSFLDYIDPDRWLTYPFFYYDAFSVTPSSCVSTTYLCFFSASIEPLELGDGDSIALGFYTSDTNGQWMLMYAHSGNGLLTAHGYEFMQPPFVTWPETQAYYHGYYSRITQNYGYQVRNVRYDNETVDFIPLGLYGQFRFPPTPLPTPTTTGPGSNDTGNTPQGCTYEQLINGLCNNPPPADVPGFGNVEPDFGSPHTACPDCPGNETVELPGVLPPGNTGGLILQGLGYCTTQGCTVDDLVALFYDMTMLFLLLSFAAVGYKGHNLWKEYQPW